MSRLGMIVAAVVMGCVFPTAGGDDQGNNGCDAPPQAKKDKAALAATCGKPGDNYIFTCISYAESFAQKPKSYGRLIRNEHNQAFLRIGWSDASIEFRRLPPEGCGRNRIESWKSPDEADTKVLYGEKNPLKEFDFKWLVPTRTATKQPPPKEEDDKGAGKQREDKEPLESEIVIQDKSGSPEGRSVWFLFRARWRPAEKEVVYEMQNRGKYPVIAHSTALDELFKSKKLIPELKPFPDADRLEFTLSPDPTATRFRPVARILGVEKVKERQVRIELSTEGGMNPIAMGLVTILVAVRKGGRR
jgi:hypothetical protein